MSWDVLFGSWDVDSLIGEVEGINCLEALSSSYLDLGMLSLNEMAVWNGVVERRLLESEWLYLVSGMMLIFVGTTLFSLPTFFYLCFLL